MARQGSGHLVLVVGPSGVGKDTLIAYCRSRLVGQTDVVFVRRAITRPADDHAEDHESVTTAAFESRLAAGDFAIHWRAHGLHYGVPAAIDEDLAAGRNVVVNASRTIIGELRERYRRLVVVSVQARSDIVRERLRRRGRETGSDVGRRLARGNVVDVDGPYVVRIDNSGTVEDAGEALLRVLTSLREHTDRR